MVCLFAPQLSLVLIDCSVTHSPGKAVWEMSARKRKSRINCVLAVAASIVFDTKFATKQFFTTE